MPSPPFSRVFSDRIRPGLILACLLLLLPCAAASRAEERVYNGSDPSLLRDMGGLGASFAPSAPFLDKPGNKLSFTGGTMTGAILGGYSSAVGVAIRDNVVSVLGGRVEGQVIGGASLAGDALSNTVSFCGAETKLNILGGISGGNGRAESNRVFFTGGRAGRDVMGGYNVGRGAASANSIAVSGGEIAGDVYSGWSGKGDAFLNSVSITGGRVRGVVWGGFSSDNGNAFNNSVSVSGGRVDGNIIGGLSYNGNAVDNSITLSGNPDLSGAVLYGGFDADFTTENDILTGNTLKIHGFQGTVSGARNFRIYDFRLPDEFDPTRPLLSVAAIPVNLTGARIGFSGTLPENAPRLKPGRIFILIDTVTGTPAKLNAGTLTQGRLRCDVALSVKDGALQAVVTGVWAKQ